MGGSMRFRRLPPTQSGLQTFPTAISDLIRAPSNSVCTQLTPLLGYNGYAMRQKLASTVTEARSSGDC
jgi:hypothetical protein